MLLFALVVEPLRDQLHYLYRAGERPVSRETLLQDVWGYNSGLTTHTLETHIYRLRQKIEKDAAAPAILVTEAGGYKLVSVQNADAGSSAANARTLGRRTICSGASAAWSELVSMWRASAVAKLSKIRAGLPPTSVPSSARLSAGAAICACYFGT